MGFMPLLGVGSSIAGSAPAFNVLGVNFDGSTTLAKASDFTGDADSSTGIFSCWMNLGNQSFTRQLLTNALGNFKVNIGSAPSPTLTLQDSGGSNVLAFNNGGALPGAWTHVLASWNVNFAAGSRIVTMYVQDVSATNVLLDSGVAFNINYTTTAWTESGPSLITGDIAELYFAPGQFLDFTVQSNRRLFISATGHPVDLGSGGATPTGVQPILYQSVRSGGVASDFLTNRGTGGNMTTSAGALTLSGTNP